MRTAPDFHDSANLRRTPVALIVERDLGLVCWIGEILAENGCRSLPAVDIWQAGLLVEQLGVKVHFVIVNRRLLGEMAMIQPSNCFPSRSW
jgi:hypothetical protein